MSDDTRYCRVCDLSEDDAESSCPINEDNPGDEWEEDNCLALAVSWERMQARHDPSAPKPAWAEPLEEAFKRAGLRGS